MKEQSPKSIRFHIGSKKQMIKEITVENAFTQEGQPDGSSVLIVDPYTGCQLQCPYCFQMNDAEWSKTIFVNTNIAEKLRQQFDAVKEDIYIGSKCDPYMPLEEKYHLTRQCLEVLSKGENAVYITTKSDNGLILKDMRLLKSFSAPLTVLMGLSNINQAHKGRNNANIHTANELKAGGIEVWCFITPVLPYVMNIDDMIAELDPSIPVYFDKLRFDKQSAMTNGHQDKKLLAWIDGNFPQHHDAYLKILYEDDLSYYKEIYTKYKSDPRFVFLTDEWEA